MCVCFHLMFLATVPLVKARRVLHFCSVSRGLHLVYSVYFVQLEPTEVTQEGVNTIYSLKQASSPWESSLCEARARGRLSSTRVSRFPLYFRFNIEERLPSEIYIDRDGYSDVMAASQLDN